jgi:hypothetical protein
MLGIKEIKKVFDNFEVDGFKIQKYDSGFVTVKLPHKEHDIDIRDFNLYIDIDDLSFFYQRVIEGINKKLNGDGWISVDYESVTCNLDEGETVKEFEHENDIDIDQAKEQAIKYILEQL